MSIPCRLRIFLADWLNGRLLKIITHSFSLQCIDSSCFFFHFSSFFFFFNLQWHSTQERSQKRFCCLRGKVFSSFPWLTVNHLTWEVLRETKKRCKSLLVLALAVLFFIYISHPQAQCMTYNFILKTVSFYRNPAYFSNGLTQNLARRTVILTHFIRHVLPSEYL